MSANPIIYCLERLTDYRQFERLCSDLMSGIGYSDIEPIGGSGDRGRDAIHHSTSNSALTIFAYSVRSDWLTKLKEDCRRIKEEEHNPQTVVFVCTSTLSANDKDSAKLKIKEEFGWNLEIYDIERIRVLLAGDLRHLLAQHPAIFCPPFFTTKGGISIAESKDTIIIDHIPEDHSLATWLAKKLSIAGHMTWCYGNSPLVGEDKDESIRTLIDTRASLYLPMLSEKSFTDTDFLGRVSSALSKENFTLPCWKDNFSDSKDTTKILQVEPARFDAGWSIGIESILNGLEARGIKPNLDKQKGQSIALRSYMPEPVTKAESETVYSNVFAVTVPKAIMVCELSEALDDLELSGLRKVWAFVKVSPTKFLSFDVPPDNVPLVKNQKIAEYAWESYPKREGKFTSDAVKELVRRSLFVACSQAGLSLCTDRNVYHFTETDNRQKNISFIHVDGRKTRVAATGTIQDGWGDRATKFKYQLSPGFKVWLDENKKLWVTTKVYVRVTDLEGVPFREKEIIRKRKKVTKNWWNKQWLARTLGVMQGLSTVEHSEVIEVGGEEKRKVVVRVKPLSWECPISIDVEAVDRIGNFQEEIASIKSYWDDDSELAEDEQEEDSADGG